LEEMQQQLEQMSDWRVKKLEDYYQNQQKRKRCDEDGSEDGSGALDVR
jgi:cytochrome c553